jgi:hypothetical protein
MDVHLKPIKDIDYAHKENGYSVRKNLGQKTRIEN